MFYNQEKRSRVRNTSDAFKGILEGSGCKVEIKSAQICDKVTIKNFKNFNVSNMQQQQDSADDAVTVKPTF